MAFKNDQWETKSNISTRSTIRQKVSKKPKFVLKNQCNLGFDVDFKVPDIPKDFHVRKGPTKTISKQPKFETSKKLVVPKVPQLKRETSKKVTPKNSPLTMKRARTTRLSETQSNSARKDLHSEFFGDFDDYNLDGGFTPVDLQGLKLALSPDEKDTKSTKSIKSS